jgi:hypothetical protein
MLQVFAFDRIGVALSDLYFVDPNPIPGQEGAERGVRLEVRVLRQGELTGSIYSARPIEVAEPVWRADLLEAADAPGTLNRAHHHPAMRDWEPRSRAFDPQMTASPVAWVGQELSNLEGLLDRAGLGADSELAADADALREAVPEITRALSNLLDRVNVGELAQAPEADGELEFARISWL